MDQDEEASSFWKKVVFGGSSWVVVLLYSAGRGCKGTIPQTRTSTSYWYRDGKKKLLPPCLPNQPCPRAVKGCPLVDHHQTQTELIAADR